MGRRPCCLKEEMNRGAWTAQEDKILTDYIRAHGEGKWRNLPIKAGLKRCGKSCRLRWLNYLRPDIKRGNISPDEEELIIRLHKLLGNRWSLIAGRLPGRTDNEIKNFWNTNLGKRVQNDEQMYAPFITQKSKSSIQQGKKISDNTKSREITPNSTTKITQPSSSLPVGVKASKCKAFIDPRPQQIENNIIDSQVTKSSMLTPAQPLHGDHDSSNPTATNLSAAATASSSSDGSRDVDPADLLMDIHIEDYHISDLLHCSGIEDNTGDICNSNNNGCSPSSGHQSMIFSEETLQDYYCRNLSDCVELTPEDSNNFQPVPSFLFDTNEEEWLGSYPSL